MPANAEIAALRDLGLSEPEITNYLNLTTADKSWQTAICAHRCALHYKFDAPPVDEHTAANNAWDAAI